MKRVRREIVAYCGFGIVTIVVGLATYLGVFAVSEYLLHVSMEDKTTTAYTVTYITAQLLQWLVVLFTTFYTNRKWVFTEADRSKGSMGRQLVLFAGSRVASFLLDLGVTYACTLLLALWITTPPVIVGVELTPGTIAKLVAAVLVIIANYVLSKLLVFRKAKSSDPEA